MTRFEVAMWDKISSHTNIQQMDLMIKVRMSNGMIYTCGEVSVAPALNTSMSPREVDKCLMEFHEGCCTTAKTILKGFYTDMRELPFILSAEEERIINVSCIQEVWIESRLVCNDPYDQSIKGVLAAN